MLYLEDELYYGYICGRHVSVENYVSATGYLDFAFISSRRKRAGGFKVHCSAVAETNTESDLSENGESLWYPPIFCNLNALNTSSARFVQILLLGCLFALQSTEHDSIVQIFKTNDN